MTPFADTPVMVLNFNGWADSIACIEAVRSQASNIWLIDNGSDEDRTAELAAMFPGLRILRLPQNLGWAGGYNRALELAMQEGYAAAYLLNNDAVPEAGAFEAAWRELGANPDAAAIGSVILSEDGRALNFAGEYYMFMSVAERASSPAGLTIEARTLHGAGVLMNLKAMRELGLFHEDYFLYWEETDWFVRARQKGRRLLLCGRSRIRHQSGASDSGANAHYYRARNRFLALSRGVCVAPWKETRLGLIAENLRRAKGSRPDKRIAIEEGLLDGLAGRFGKRRPHRSSLQRGLMVAALKALMLPARAVSRASDRRGF